MKGSYKKGRELEFTVAAWDNIWYAEHHHDVAVVVTILPAGQRGVLMVDAAARALEDGPEGHPLARVTESWPNAHEQPFETFLYGLTFKLHAMVESARGERKRYARR